jgi:L-threonylcarbamoyladenylate synthase
MAALMESKPPPPGARASRRKGRRIIIADPEQPDVPAIEEVADVLLEGGICGLPTDTVYGLAASSTNAEAVRRLYRIKGREPGKPIPLLIHSMRDLPRLVREIPEAIEPLLERYWPGALTIVFRKHTGSFAGVTSDETIGIRMPDDMVTLAVLSMVARPLAVTSANPAGKPPAVTPDEVLEAFGDKLDCLLDAGRTPGEEVSTVLSVVESPFRVLRQGAVSFQALKELLGDELAGP